MRKPFSIAFAAVLLAALPSAAQDLHFSQYEWAPMLLNPAKTGTQSGIEQVHINYRSQWTAPGAPFSTMHASFDMPLMRKKNDNAYIGAGIYVYRDMAGDSKFGTSKAALSLSGIVPMDDINKISLGLQAGAAQRSADMGALQWGNQYDGMSYDPSLPHNEINTLNSFVYSDFAAGLFWQMEDIEHSLAGKTVSEVNAGISVYHINKPGQKFFWSVSDKLYRKWALHSSARLDMSDMWAIVPSAAYFRQGPSGELLLGALLRYNLREGTKFTGYFVDSGLLFGAQYRWKDAAVPQVFLEIGNYAIGLSYDFNTSSLSEVSGYMGGFEVSLRYMNTRGVLYKGR